MIASVTPVSALAEEAIPLAEGETSVVAEVEQPAEAETPAVTEQPAEEPAETEAPAETPAVTEQPAEEPAATETPAEEPAATEQPAEEPEETETPAGEPAEEQDPEEEPGEDGILMDASAGAAYSLTKGETEDDVQSYALQENTFYRIFHLDCGRKYFSVDQIKALIDSLAQNHYTHLELAVGNDGLRFLLGDMSVTANGKTYTSEAVKAGIQAGNKKYYDAGTNNELTQTEMDTIISYANEKGIGIIPLINTPGHMDAILNCMVSVGIPDPAYSTSARTVNVTNTEAVNFTLALVNKYIQYFAGKSCTIFNMGCDEYANDVSNSGFAGLISSGEYGDFITYVNAMAAQVKAAHMTPMAFNDGIYYNSNTSSGTFDTDIAVAYWTPGWPGYSPAPASFLAEKGHKIINTNDAWYYVLGRQAGDSYTIATAQNGVRITKCTDIPGDNDPTAAGCMICLWCDTPSAGYSTDEVRNVNGLISTFATNNSDRFAADSGGNNQGAGSDDVAVTEKKPITVTVGQTATAIISGANYAGSYDTEDPSIATVEVTGTDATEATTTYTQASVTCNSLISRDSKNWQAVSGYYYKTDDGNYYPVYAKRSSNGFLFWYTYTYTWGYSTTSSTLDVTQIGTQETDSTSTTPNITVYTESKTEGTPASTTVTFTGVAVGTTYVTVGNTRYTIKVVAEDLSKVPPRTVEYWITNLPVTADGATSKNISAQDAYGEAGVDISTLVPATGTYAYGSVVFWKGTVLGSNNRQTTASGAANDKTGAGKDFNRIRYYNGSWQYFYEVGGTWNSISSDDQVVIYWLRPTEVTKEITTLVKDWGFAPDNQGDNENKVALTVAVVYPDGTVSPAEGDMYSTSTTLFNYWENRNIGLVAPVNNSDYEIAKITVTNGTRVQTGTGQWGANDTITWDKVTNEAGERWYNEHTYWDETVGGTPMVNGATGNIIWSNYNTAKLVLIYLKPVHYETNLIVNWVDDSASGALISTMEVAVSSDGTPITFYNGLKQTSDLPTVGVGGTFTLDDDAYVTNSSNVNQKFNKNISTVPDVADQYKSGLYQYVSADLSADGKTLTLHYNIDSTKLSKKYVVDFGLPVTVPLSELVANSVDVKTVEIAAGNATVNENKSITYQPNTVMTGVATVTVKLIYNNDERSQPITIGFVPATTVYYEEGFAELTGFSSTGSKGTVTQALEAAGEKNYNYGYDPAYASSNAMSVNVPSSEKGGVVTFTFAGDGVDIYTKSTIDSGTYMISITDINNNLIKLVTVNTMMKNGEGSLTLGQNVTALNVPIATIKMSNYGTYKVKMSQVKSGSAGVKTVYFDGFRVYNTLGDLNNDAYDSTEKNPQYFEMRDSLLGAYQVNANTSSYADQIGEDIISQVYTKNETTKGAILLGTAKYQQEEITDLLDNGPKNEVYLQPRQSLTFTLSCDAQIGLKSLTGQTVSISGVNDTLPSLSSATDMFYNISKGEHTITNTSENGGILAITKIKVANENLSGAQDLFAGQTAQTLTFALTRMGFAAAPAAPVTAAASLTVNVVDEQGAVLASNELTAEGTVGESHTFPATDITKAVPAVDGYTVDISAAADVTVPYGETQTVTFTAVQDKPEPTPEPTPEPEPQPNPGQSIITGIINTIKNIFNGIFGRRW